MASDNALATLFDPKIWPKLNCLVLVDPNWAILPVRMRKNGQGPLYDRGDAAQIRGGPVVHAGRRAGGDPLGRPGAEDPPGDPLRSARAPSAKSTLFRGMRCELRSNEPFFKTIVEQRQIAKRGAKDDPDLAALEMGLKQMAASGAYGIYAEINVTPGEPDEAICRAMCIPISLFLRPKVHDERPGAFTNPIIASLVTGGARLMLAMLEREVTRARRHFCLLRYRQPRDNLRRSHALKISHASRKARSARSSSAFDALSPYDRDDRPASAEA